MKIFYTLLIALPLWGITSCRNAEKPLQNKASTEQLTKEQTAFINEWAARFNTGHIPILSLFRSRHLNKTDLKEMTTYLSRQDSLVDFSEAKESFQIKTELSIDTLLTKNISWVNDHDVSACSGSDFWVCFNRRNPAEAFYYLTPPQFSADKKWCLMGVNYMSKQKGESYGGGRLYRLVANKWEEVALLSYWGKKPE